MKIKCVIIDDNLDDLKNVANLVNNLSIETENIFEIYSYSNSNLLQENYNNDLYILDIDMPGLNGFQLANSIYKNNKDASIIFCSNHEDLVFDSFKLNAFYFVRKSFLKDDLILALRKYLSKIYSLNKDYILVTNNRVVPIPLKQIIYFEVSKNDLFIHTKSKEFRERKSMKKLKKDLSSMFFIQINQNFLVNANEIKEIYGNSVILTNGLSFQIPKHLIREVKTEYLKILAR